jgi:hypothetical protein
MTGDREPRDIEARLRASLHAYAEAVDDEPPARLTPTRAAGSPRSTALRGWRSSVLAGAAVAAVAGGTWFVLDDGNSPSPTAAPGVDATVLDGDSRAESAPEQPTDPSAEAQAGAAADAAVPSEALGLPSEVEVGVSYPFDLYTHCGIDGADVGGVWFAPDPPLDESAGSWPAGWGNPYQRGTLTLESAVEAVFRDDAGYELVLRAVPDSERPPRCE